MSKKISLHFKLGNKKITPSEMVNLINKNPERVASEAASNLQIITSKEVLDSIRNNPFGHLVDTNGDVETSGLTGLEEALIVIAFIGVVSGFLVGYQAGFEDGMEAATEDSGGGGDDDSGDDTGEDSGGENEGSDE